MQSDDIDVMLSKRVPPPQSNPDLANCIIHTALSAPKQTPSKSWKDYMMVFLSSALPRASMGFAVVALVVVASMAQFIPSSSKQADNQTAQVSYSTDSDWAMVLDVYSYDDASL